jgi:RNA polymerase sigma-70 factor, ECF subfamily
MSALNAPANNSVIRSSLKEMSDARLVSAAKSGDAVAFYELSRRHSNKILWRAYRIVKNRQDAEDVRQESFMKAFLHLKDFEERASFSSWLTRITIHSALMNLRKKRGHVETSIDGTNDDQGSGYRWEPQDPAESPESRCAQREREELLKEAIQGLPPKLRDIVQLRYGEDRSMEEVAQLLHISVPAAKSRAVRARTALRVSLVAKLKQADSVGYQNGSFNVGLVEEGVETCISTVLS